MIRPVFAILVGVTSAYAATPEADSARGEKLFESLSCIQCHSINGKGAHKAADLGRRIDRNYTPATLAATMWNHAPTMWAAMRESDVRAGDLDEQAAADLFAHFYSSRFFDKPGDAARGRRLFTERACAQCHGLTDAIRQDVKPVNQWTALADPVSLTEAMWNHAPDMFAKFNLKKISWPQLSGQDLADLLVYFRNLTAAAKVPGVFETSSGANGETVFNSKGCAACHRSGSLLAPRIKGQTLTEVAAEMWDHAPRMATPPAHFEPGEMRELLSYLWARQFFEDAGDARRGARIYTAKHCAACHDNASSGARRLTGKSYTGATMVSALWHHGPGMLAQMKTKGISWPRFDGQEMSNLIAFLNSTPEKK